MKNFDIKKIKIITLVVTTIIFVSIGLFRIYNDTTILNNQHNKREKIILEHISYLYQKQVQRLNKALGSRIEYIAKNKNIKEAFKTKKLQKLQKVTLARFNIMKTAFPTLENIKFFSKDSTVLFIVNKKVDTYKKNYIPPIIQEVLKTKKVYFGFSPYFKFDKKTIYKIAIPVYDDKEFLGVIAAGIDMSYLIKEISHDIQSIYSKNIDVKFFLKKNNKNFNTNTFIQYGPYISPNLNDNFNDLIVKTKFNAKYSDHIKFNDKNYHFSFNQIRINDFNNDIIGTLSYMIDETDYIDLKNTLTKNAILFPLIVFLLLMVFFNYLFHYFSKKIINGYNRTKKIIDTQDSFIVISNGVVMSECNQALLDFLGFDTFKHLLKKHSCICDFFLKDDNKDYIQKNTPNGIYWSKYILDNPNKIHKVLMKNKNDEKYIFEVKAKEFEYQDDINEIIFIFNDITLLENEKEESAKKEKLLFEQSKMASMGEMIGNIAHQWRQPLSVISTASTGMQIQKKYGSLSDEELYSTCDAINNNAQYLSKTIDDFSNFIKGERIRTIFKLKNDIESFLHLVDSSIKNHHINIILDLKEDIKIDGYENELTQCLINIFNNAKDVLKNINEKNRYLFITTQEIDNNAIIKIKDSGGGVEENILSKIFEPYFTTKHQSQGTGLGLHMTYNLIVDGMKGSIDINNVTYEYNKQGFTGAEFIIKIPIKKLNEKGETDE